jgi:prepilin-type N-terminal cleavage/methylation domain-containing protein
MIKSAHDKKISNNSGFTLIEMMVSVALFSIVLIVVMGSILTIVDVNRKSQSLTVVMNDLSFALDSFNRTVKTGEIETLDGLHTAITILNQDEQRITYEYDSNAKAILRSVEGGSQDVPITSDEVEIERAEFTVFDGTDQQPRVLVLIRGVANVSPRISSDFTIQTTISERNLDDDDLN